ncbi:hypothetical protein ZOSMA_129G00220 [Zostera marina]|uniref:DUF4378 domain-containing protein n=1 Tax=Zostera marina TaxID=29655 RepID=A0A0K9Q1U2_ZOSMR|nr:hypothetical protein ZOSMA_129G00220 [Zostera marina]
MKIRGSFRGYSTYKWNLKKKKFKSLISSEDKSKMVNDKKIPDTSKKETENSRQLPQTDDRVLQKTLDEVLDGILQTTLIDQTSNSEELKYVLNILRSNKELLLQVLQDPKIVNLILINNGTDDSQENKDGIELSEKTMEKDSKVSRNSSISQSSSSYASSSFYSSSNRGNKWGILRSTVRDIKRRLRQTFGICRKQRITDDNISLVSDYLMEGDNVISPSIKLLESRRSENLNGPQKVKSIFSKDISTGEEISTHKEDFDIIINEKDDQSVEEPFNATENGGNDGSSTFSSTLLKQNTSEEQLSATFSLERLNPGYAKLPSPRKLRIIPEFEDESCINPLTSLDLCVGDTEFKFEYLKALLEASGLCDIDAKFTDSNSTRVFDLNLYDEIETPSGEIPNDLRNLFDCISEVVENIHKRSSNHIPWTCFADNNIKRFPLGDKLIQEAWKCLNVWFVPHRSMKLLKIVEKDLCSSQASWIDIRSCVEEIGIGVGDEILDKLLEEIILELF